MRPRTPKKTETIEIRVPHATKAAFMAKCRGDGQTASEVVRRFIDHEVEGRRPTMGLERLWQVLAAALMGLAVGAVAAPSLAHPIMTGATACAHVSPPSPR